MSRKIPSQFLIPALLIIVGGGFAAGIGVYAFIYAKGYSYLTNDPGACANCHVMRGHFDRWNKSSHHAVATCNDCHTPAFLPGKYLVKGVNGFFHSLAFTTQRFHEPIRIKSWNRRIAENSCMKCHSDLVDMVARMDKRGGGLSCIRCHGAVGHPD
jgi:cytochrome c nitrite reductase small subunit